MDETPRDISFCTWAIQSDELFEVADATLDARFTNNPLVVGPPFVRHYVGSPISANGQNVGTLCLLSPNPGTISAEQGQLYPAWPRPLQSACSSALAFLSGSPSPRHCNADFKEANRS